jgi:hypothetical protein
MSKRPLSFIGKDQEKLEKLSVQVFGVKDRNVSGRSSGVERKSNKGEVDLFTPDTKKKSTNK